MTQGTITFRNGRIFDGTRLRDGYASRFSEGVLSNLGISSDIPIDGAEIDLKGDILSPGFTDLQVNGGGGVMFNDDPSVETLRRIAQAHRCLGTIQFLPTLISDTPDITRAAIAAVKAAIEARVPGIAGLHLEGPHLSLARKGAHAADVIRPMEQGDLEMLLSAAESLPLLKVTIAPESVTVDQTEVLARAGVLVSLGHSDADFQTCQKYITAGARCVTHLFNAMSQIGNRAPGLVGAALANGNVAAGLIADAVHVHPDVMRIAWLSKRAPGRIFLVSDAMAVAGSTKDQFNLNGREILRKDGQLRLADDTLAGADLDLVTAISVLVNKVGIDLEEALSAAIRRPAELCGLHKFDLQTGRSDLSDVIRIKSDLSGVHPWIHETPAKSEPTP